MSKDLKQYLDEFKKTHDPTPIENLVLNNKENPDEFNEFLLEIIDVIIDDVEKKQTDISKYKNLLESILDNRKQLFSKTDSGIGNNDYYKKIIHKLLCHIQLFSDLLNDDECIYILIEDIKINCYNQVINQLCEKITLNGKINCKLLFKSLLAIKNNSEINDYKFKAGKMMFEELEKKMVWDYTSVIIYGFFHPKKLNKIAKFSKECDKERND